MHDDQSSTVDRLQFLAALAEVRLRADMEELIFFVQVLQPRDLMKFIGKIYLALDLGPLESEHLLERLSAAAAELDQNITKAARTKSSADDHA